MYKKRIAVLPFCSVYLESDIDNIEFQFIQKDYSNEFYPDVKDLSYVKISREPDGKEHIIRCYIDNCSVEMSSYSEPDERIEVRTYENKDNTIRFSIGCWGECWPLYETSWDNDFDYEVGWPESGLSYKIKKYTSTRSFAFCFGWISSDKAIDSNDELAMQLYNSVDPTNICFGSIEYDGKLAYYEKNRDKHRNKI